MVSITYLKFFCDRSLRQSMSVPIDDDSDDGFAYDDEEEGAVPSNRDRRTESDLQDSERSQHGSTGDRDYGSFVKIISEMVTTGHAQGDPADSLLMEIKGCKFAHNKVERRLAYVALCHIERALYRIRCSTLYYFVCYAMQIIVFIVVVLRCFA
jgi:hypothetical protein